MAEDQDGQLEEKKEEELEEKPKYPEPKEHTKTYATECLWRATSGLVQRNQYFSFVLQQMRRVVVEPHCGIPIAAILLGRSGSYYLFVNRMTFPSMTPAHQMMVLRHEAGHVAQRVFDRVLNKNRTIFNMASDMAVNAEIKRESALLADEGDIPVEEYCWESALYPDKMGWPDDEISEQYYDRLMNMDAEAQEVLAKHGIPTRDGDPQGQQGSPGQWGAGGGHLEWENIPEALKEYLRQHGDEAAPDTGEVRRMILENAIAAFKRADGRGDVPGSAESAVRELIKQPYNFKNALCRFVTWHLTPKREATWMRANRRLRDSYPGTTRKPGMAMWIIVDTSGSVSDRTLSIFGGHIEQVVDQTKADVMVIECDAEVQAVYPFRGKIDRSNFRGMGRGGTVFGPAFDHIRSYKERKFRRPSCVVALTDGYFEHDLPKQPFPTLWCLPADKGPAAVEWGTSLILPPSDEE